MGYFFKYNYTNFSFDNPIQEESKLLNLFSSEVCYVLKEKYCINVDSAYSIKHELLADNIRTAGDITSYSGGGMYGPLSIRIALTKDNRLYLENTTGFREGIDEEQFVEEVRQLLLKNKVIYQMDAEKGNLIVKKPEKSGGCYVATAVYGSYDCPEVWTLRRYRDYSLSKTLFGRAFIKTYYAISPTLVKWFGESKWFKTMWKTPLDRMVKRLNERGYENTNYYDCN